MSAAWTGVSVRGTLLARRRLGREEARRVAQSPTLDRAVAVLLETPYRRDLELGAPLGRAQRQLEATALWHLRILGGWTPARGVDVVRVLAGWWELANIRGRIATISGGAAPQPHVLGSLGTAWSRASRATTLPELRAVLAPTAWGDPGGEDPAAVVLGLTLRWGERLRGVPGAASWGAGWSVLTLARAAFVDGRRPAPEQLGRSFGVEAGWAEAESIAWLRRRVGPGAAWVLEGVESPADLWRGEARWWSRVEADARTMLKRRGRPEAAVGAGALLLVDCWRARAALELAAGGGHPVEAFDAVA